MRKLFSRKPDLVIGDPEQPYMLRWMLFPRNGLFNIYLHKFMRDDYDRAFHDHPWWSVSLVVSGGYFEVRPAHDGSTTRHWVPRWSIVPRWATYSHRIECERDELGQCMPCWTVFVVGPVIRTWGFWCPAGWKPWMDVVEPSNRGVVDKSKC
jgi:hypothetical protein